MAGKDSGKDLTDLPGVGAATAKKLKDAGLNTVAKIRKAGRDGLTAAGISTPTAARILKGVAQEAGTKAKEAAKKATKKASATAAKTAKKATNCGQGRGEAIRQEGHQAPPGAPIERCSHRRRKGVRARRSKRRPFRTSSSRGRSDGTT
ncbi:MAG: hypothetical protein CM15mP128_5070 [Methanobacteriota archaeon]|nr:MAG: hypothetical protein CM15mP128_5070 [Euryarchaeota archaeon]